MCQDAEAQKSLWVGGGIGMGNTCKPMAVSFQCMTKSTTNKKKKNVEKKNKRACGFGELKDGPLSFGAAVWGEQQRLSLVG